MLNKQTVQTIGIQAENMNKQRKQANSENLCPPPQGTHYPFTLTVKMPEKWLSSTSGKSDKK